MTLSAAEILHNKRQTYDVTSGRNMTPSAAGMARLREWCNRTAEDLAGPRSPYAGILLNSRSSDQNASAYMTAPSRNGAPGSSIGAFGEVK